MPRYLVGRVIQLFVVLAAALLIVFLALHVVADPARTMLPVGTSQEAIDSFNAVHGFDQPFLTRVTRFFAGALRGDFGPSLWHGADALSVVLARLPATLMVVVPAAVIGAGTGVALGSRAARRPDSAAARSLNVISYGVISVAEFWLGIMLILVLSVQLGWLPTGGYDPKPWVLVMPTFVLALRPFAHTFQLTRSTMLAEYGKQYVLAARARGFTESSVARRQVLQNAAPPVLTLFFYDLGRIFVGAAVVIEVVFAWPGIGRLAVGALERGDVFLVQAIVAVAAIIVASLNLIADLLYFRLDPRIRGLVKGEAS